MANLPYISADLIKNYQGHIENSASQATSKRKIASLKKFFNWASEKGHIEENPLANKSIPVATPDIAFIASNKPVVNVSSSKHLNITNTIRLALGAGMIVVTFLILRSLKVPIPFIFTPASENTNLITISGGSATPTVNPSLLPSIVPSSTPSPVPSIVPNTTPTATPLPSNNSFINGVLTLEGDNPGIKGVGGLLVSSENISISAVDGSEGDIVLNPDGSGNLNLIFEGNAGNQVNTTAANLKSGSLYYGYVGNNNTSYNLLLLQSGSSPTTKFSVDASGNAFIKGSITNVNDINLTGNLKFNGTTFLTSSGGLTNIRGFNQASGNFEVIQGTGDYASINKTLNSGTGAAVSDGLKITLDESESPSSSYDALVVSRIGGNSDAYAIYVPEGNVKFNSDLGLGGNLTATDGTFNDKLTVLGQADFVKQPTEVHTGTWAIGSSTWNQQDASVYINPSSGAADSNLLAIAINGSVVFDVDAEGDIYGKNLILTGSTSTGSTAISGDLSVEGNTTLGDATTDTIAFTGRVLADSDLIPITTTGTNDLGSVTLPWDNLYSNSITTTTIDTSFTEGSIVYAGTNGVLTEDNGGLYFAPGSKLAVGSNLFFDGKINSVGSAAGTLTNLYLVNNSDSGTASRILFSPNNDFIATDMAGYIDSIYVSGSRTDMAFGVYGSSGSLEAFRATGQGFFGIGDSSPDYTLEVSDSTNTPNFALSDDDVSHGLTTLSETDVFSRMTSLSSTAGGVQWTAVSDSDAQALNIRAVMGSTDPTDTTAAIKLIGAKSNGTTGMADFDAAETVFQIQNNDNSASFTVEGDGDVVIIGSGTTCTIGNGTGGTSCTSDERLKENIHDLNIGLNEILALRTVEYNWKDKNKNQAKNIGLVAQEVQKVIPQVVNKVQDDYLAIDYSSLVVPLIKSVQELNEKIPDTVNFVTENITAGSEIVGNITVKTTLTAADIFTNSIIANVVKGTQFIAENISAGSIIATNLTVNGTTTGFKFVAENIEAGAITTKEVTTQSISTITASVDNLLITAGLVSPKVNTNTIASVVEGEKITVESDTNFEGSVQAETVNVNSDATVSGTLYADKVVANSIEGGSREEIEKLLGEIDQSREMIRQAQGWESYIASGSAKLDEVATSNLFVTEGAVLANATITGNLNFPGFVLSSSEATGATLNTLTAPLSIQSLALAPIELMAGKIKINTNGDAEFLGNVNIAGKLNIESETSTKELSTQKLVIASDVPTQTEQSINGVIETNATAGTAVVSADSSEITIKNPNISDSTLVYVTPTSTTNNQVLFVKSKESGKFVVGFLNNTEADVSFNWWVIDTK